MPVANKQNEQLQEACYIVFKALDTIVKQHESIRVSKEKVLLILCFNVCKMYF